MGMTIRIKRENPLFCQFFRNVVNGSNITSRKGNVIKPNTLPVIPERQIIQPRLNKNNIRGPVRIAEPRLKFLIGLPAKLRKKPCPELPAPGKI